MSTKETQTRDYADFDFETMENMINSLLKDTLTAEQRVIRRPVKSKALDSDDTSLKYCSIPSLIGTKYSLDDNITLNNLQQHNTSESYTQSQYSEVWPHSYYSYTHIDNVNQLSSQSRSRTQEERGIVGASASASSPDIKTSVPVHALYREYKSNKRSDIFNSLCSFCKQNCEHPSIYTTHRLKSSTGIIECPILRKYVCPNCGATGDRAHTVKYCPLTPSSTKRAFHISEAVKTRMANGRKRM